MKEFTSQTVTRLVRTVIVINFALLLLLLSPLGHSHRLYETVRGAGIADVAFAVLLAWVIGSTLLVTALSVWRRLKASGAPKEKLETRARALDDVLIAGWWIGLVLVCAYAFMMGMGG